MSVRERITPSLAVISLVVLVFALYIQTPFTAVAETLSQPEQAALKDFSKRAQDYIKMVHGLPADKLKPTSDVAALNKERVDLREAIKAARPDAAQGNMFTPEAADAFRKLLAHTMAGHDGPKIRASLAHAEPVAPKDIVVNGAYPNADGQPIQSVPPTLLLNLPVLPKGLEYCIAGKALALRDTNANLVVDFIPNALP